MFCPKCGKQVSGESRFCEFCGATIMPQQGGASNAQPRPIVVRQPEVTEDSLPE